MYCPMAQDVEMQLAILQVHILFWMCGLQVLEQNTLQEVVLNHFHTFTFAINK